MAESIVAFVCGLVFAAGLVVGGMTQPAKVLNFLDVTGAFDPSLAFVMGGALATHAALRRLVLKLPRPLLATEWPQAPAAGIDARLITGAAIFGAGWGLAGLCPGPTIVAVGGDLPAAAVVLAGMLAGMWLHDRTTNRDG